MQLPLLFWLSTQPTQHRSRLAACGGGGATGESLHLPGGGSGPLSQASTVQLTKVFIEFIHS